MLGTRKTEEMMEMAMTEKCVMITISMRERGKGGRQEEKKG